jgi:pyroglutamyl-peptidase
VKKRLLVTGFGPFPGMPRNPSAAVARNVAALLGRRTGVDARALILPTTYAAVSEVLVPAVREGGYDAVLMIGVAGRAKAVRLERRGANRAALFSPDAAKKRPAALILGKGPPYRASTVPALRLLPLFRRHDVPCTVSQDAGRYLCNAGYFTALAHPMPVMFVHIPRPPRTSRPGTAGRRSRLPWRDRLAAALAEVALALLVDARRRRG